MATFHHTRESYRIFDGTNYATWKKRMMVYLISLDFELWEIVSQGSKTLMKIINGRRVPKQWKEFDAKDKRWMTMNGKARVALSESLTKEELNKVGTCRTTNDMWNTLEVIYGKYQVEKQCLELLSHQYNRIAMKQKETIREMHARFMEIITSMFDLGEVIPENEQVHRILQVLPREWNEKVNRIKASRNLDAMTLAELMGILIAYELSHVAKYERRTCTQNMVTVESCGKNSSSRKALASSWNDSDSPGDSDVPRLEYCISAFEVSNVDS